MCINQICSEHEAMIWNWLRMKSKIIFYKLQNVQREPFWALLKILKPEHNRYPARQIQFQHLYIFSLFTDFTFYSTDSNSVKGQTLSASILKVIVKIWFSVCLLPVSSRLPLACPQMSLVSPDYHLSVFKPTCVSGSSLKS